MTEDFQTTLRHDDFTYSSELCNTKPWIDTFVATLIHLENSKYRYENAYYLAILIQFPPTQDTAVSYGAGKNTHTHKRRQDI